jgi:cation diffusion facilitator family transporter
MEKDERVNQCRYDLVFTGEEERVNERRTRIVISLTAAMMILEIAAGVVLGSMALLADGWHMASHAAALGITALGYALARRHALNPRFCFGTGKIGELAGFSSALLLALISLLMTYESVRRFFAPVRISFDEAIAVAILGLIVNVVSALLLQHPSDPHEHPHAHVDHNLKAAYLHVLADALTSVLAIFALSAGRFLGWVWMDPVMGVVGSAVIGRWAYHLLRDTGRMLLDVTADHELAEKIRELIESDGHDRVSDLHVWRVGPCHYAAILSVTSNQKTPPKAYKAKLESLREICHITVEVNPLPAES